MVSVFHESNRTLSKLRSGEIPKGSIIRIQWPSGNSESVRFHGWSSTYNCHNKSFMIGCNMSWDNGATQWYDLADGVVSLIEKPKPNDERWPS